MGKTRSFLQLWGSTQAGACVGKYSVMTSTLTLSLSLYLSSKLLQIVIATLNEFGGRGAKHWKFTHSKGTCESSRTVYLL